MNDIPNSSDNTKHVFFSLKLAVFLIGASLLLTLGLNQRLISQEWVERGFGILLGLVMGVYANAIPKFTGTPPTSAGDATIAQSLRRVSGWALTLGFFVSAGLWAFAPIDIAQVGSIVCPGVSALIVLVVVIKKCIQCRKSRARDISSPILFLVFVSLPTVNGQERLEFAFATPISQGIANESVRQITDEVQAYINNGMVVGGELLIIKNRKNILHEVYGDRNRESKQPMQRNTIFNIRSMTKPLTGVAVQMLADEGKLNLQDAASKYLPGFELEKSKGITVEQLLQHRSGLPLSILTARLDEYSDLQNQTEAVGEKGPQFEPGEKFWYSDAGSDAAAAIVEKISGKTIDRFIHERILQPLGMHDSFFLHNSTSRGSVQGLDGTDPRMNRVASLYIGSQEKWLRFWTPEDKPLYPFAWGSQSLYSTPQDYARFLTMWLDNGFVGNKRLLSDDAMERILTPVSLMKQLGGDKPYPCGLFGMQPHYGQMSMLYAPGDKPTRSNVIAFGHSGSDGTGAWAFPAKELIVCYFTQSRGQASPIRLETTIQDALLYRKNGAKAPVDLQPLIGTYHATFGPFNAAPFKVIYCCGKLALDIPNDLIYELREPDAEGRWALVSNPTNALTFKKDDDGKIVSMVLHKPRTSIEMPRKRPEIDDAGK